MADFKVQRGESSMGTGVSSVTITAGTDYDAPSSITKAFCFLTSSVFSSEGSTNTFGQTDEHTVSVSNPSNLLTSITFTRTSTSAPIKVQWEILEYTGSAGGVNEFKVLGEEVLSFTTESSKNTSAWTPADDNDVVGFITGQECTDTGANRAGTTSNMCTSEWDAANNYITLTRDETQYDADISVAAIEFTGSNWTIQRITHSFTSADTNETESMTTIGALTEAFMHVQGRADTRTGGENGLKAWFTSTSQITFRVDAIYSTVDAVAWVIENPDLVVEHKSGSWASSATDPDTTDVSVTTVDAMAETTIQGVGCTTGGSSPDSHQYMMGARLTSTSNVRLSRGISDEARDYVFSVVQLPSAAAGGATVTPPVGSLGMTGYAPTVVVTDHQSVDVPVASITASGYAPTILTPDLQTVDVPQANISLSGLSPSIQATDHQTVDVPLASLLLTGFAPTVVANGNQVVDVPVGSVGLSGAAPTVQATEHQIIDAPVGTLTLSGYAPDVGNPITVSVPVGVLALNGFAPSISTTEHVNINVPVASISIAGLAPTVAASDEQIVDVPVGNVTLSGYAPNVIYITIVTPDGRTVVIEAETRTLAIAQDNRVLAIAQDNRVLAIEQDS